MAWYRRALRKAELDRRPGSVRNRAAKKTFPEEIRDRCELISMRSYMNFGGGNALFEMVRQNNNRGLVR